jgi:hypothetical protein
MPNPPIFDRLVWRVASARVVGQKTAQRHGRDFSQMEDQPLPLFIINILRIQLPLLL